MYYAGKSFHLSGYAFDSGPEFEFFKLGLPEKKIRKIYFTDMLTTGQTEFFVHSIDTESNALRAYYPDILIEQEDGSYLSVDIRSSLPNL